MQAFKGMTFDVKNVSSNASAAHPPDEPECCSPGPEGNSVTSEKSEFETDAEEKNLNLEAAKNQTAQNNHVEAANKMAAMGSKKKSADIPNGSEDAEPEAEGCESLSYSVEEGETKGNGNKNDELASRDSDKDEGRSDAEKPEGTEEDLVSTREATADIPDMTKSEEPSQNLDRKQMDDGVQKPESMSQIYPKVLQASVVVQHCTSFVVLLTELKSSQCSPFALYFSIVVRRQKVTHAAF